MSNVKINNIPIDDFIEYYEHFKNHTIKDTYDPLYVHLKDVNSDNVTTVINIQATLSVDITDESEETTSTVYFFHAQDEDGRYMYIPKSSDGYTYIYSVTSSVYSEYGKFSDGYFEEISSPTELANTDIISIKENPFSDYKNALNEIKVYNSTDSFEKLSSDKGGDVYENPVVVQTSSALLSIRQYFESSIVEYVENNNLPSEYTIVSCKSDIDNDNTYDVLSTINTQATYRFNSAKTKVYTGMTGAVVPASTGSKSTEAICDYDSSNKYYMTFYYGWFSGLKVYSNAFKNALSSTSAPTDSHHYYCASSDKYYTKTYKYNNFSLDTFNSYYDTVNGVYALNITKLLASYPYYINGVTTSSTLSSSKYTTDYESNINDTVITMLSSFGVGDLTTDLNIKMKIATDMIQSVADRTIYTYDASITNNATTNIGTTIFELGTLTESSGTGVAVSAEDISGTNSYDRISMYDKYPSTLEYARSVAEKKYYTDDVEMFMTLKNASTNVTECTIPEDLNPALSLTIDKYKGEFNDIRNLMVRNIAAIFSPVSNSDSYIDPISAFIKFIPSSIVEKYEGMSIETGDSDDISFKIALYDSPTYNSNYWKYMHDKIYESYYYYIIYSELKSFYDNYDEAIDITEYSYLSNNLDATKTADYTSALYNLIFYMDFEEYSAFTDAEINGWTDEDEVEHKGIREILEEYNITILEETAFNEVGSFTYKWRKIT